MNPETDSDWNGMLEGDSDMLEHLMEENGRLKRDLAELAKIMERAALVRDSFCRAYKISCKNCGRLVGQTWSFCPNCAQPLKPITDALGDHLEATGTSDDTLDPEFVNAVSRTLNEMDIRREQQEEK